MSGSSARLRQNVPYPTLSLGYDLQVTLVVWDDAFVCGNPVDVYPISARLA